MIQPLRPALATIAALGAALAAGRAADPAPQGYLAPATVDITGVVPPAPVKGDPRYATDRKVFKAMGRLIGSTRWRYATSDVAYDTPTMLRDFSCAAGIALSPEGMPATTRLLARVSADTSRSSAAAKNYWKRLRPFQIDPGETCEAKAEVANNYDYPSGHTTKGWTFGLILAELLPDRATPILTRARAYGESRIVCRVHNMSAVEAGRTGATVTMESVRRSPAFQADLAAARAELATARAPAPDAAQCAADAAVLEPSVLAGLAR